MAVSDTLFQVSDTPTRVGFPADVGAAAERMTVHQKGTHVLRRAEAWAPSAEVLAVYAGRYYSPKLKAVYTARVEEGAFVLRHLRLGDIPLRPREPDPFGGPGPFARVAFERGAVRRPSA